MNKYKIRTDLQHPMYKNLFRIESLKNFNDVSVGDIGGYIEDENNLSHENNCWIYNDAIVCERAEIRDSAMVKDNAEVFGTAVVKGESIVDKNSIIRYDDIIDGESLNLSSLNYNITITSKYVHLDHCSSKLNDLDSLHYEDNLVLSKKEIDTMIKFIKRIKNDN